MSGAADQTDKSWYLLFTKPRQEHIALENLGRQGYKTYLPLTRRKCRRHGRRVVVEEPFFPRYMFIHLDTVTDDWSPIRSTIGVSGIVRYGHQPARVPLELIHDLRARAGDDGYFETRLICRRGDRVRIHSGLMCDCEGIFLADSGPERVIILLHILGGVAHVEMEADAVSLAV